MKGTIITLRPDGSTSVLDLHRTATLDHIKTAIGGGHIEVVPGFTSIESQGHLVSCVVFCDEDGKRKNLPLNAPGTVLWGKCLGLHIAKMRDHLVGNIAIVFGDAEFMEAL